MDYGEDEYYYDDEEEEGESYRGMAYRPPARSDPTPYDDLTEGYNQGFPDGMGGERGPMPGVVVLPSPRSYLPDIQGGQRAFQELAYQRGVNRGYRPQHGRRAGHG